MKEPIKIKDLDEKGFVFLDHARRPYWCRLWEGEHWLFYWHVDNRWVTLRKLESGEVGPMSTYRLPEDQASLYMDLHQKNI